MLIPPDIDSTTQTMSSVDTNFNTTTEAWPASSSERTKHRFSTKQQKKQQKKSVFQV